MWIRTPYAKYQERIPSTCHPERLAYAHGLCKHCHWAQYRQDHKTEIATRARDRRKEHNAIVEATVARAEIVAALPGLSEWSANPCEHEPKYAANTCKSCYVHQYGARADVKLRRKLARKLKSRIVHKARIKTKRLLIENVK